MHRHTTNTVSVSVCIYGPRQHSTRSGTAYQTTYQLAAVTASAPSLRLTPQDCTDASLDPVPCQGHRGEFGQCVCGRGCSDWFTALTVHTHYRIQIPHEQRKYFTLTFLLYSSHSKLDVVDEVKKIHLLMQRKCLSVCPLEFNHVSVIERYCEMIFNYQKYVTFTKS